MKPYGTEEAKAEQVRNMFDGIAPAYDRLNGLFTLGIDNRWRRRLARMVARQAPAEVLDLATGTGDMALMLARYIPGAKITGADVSANMLAVAAAKTEKKGLSGRIGFVEAPAEKLPFGDGEFDAVTVVFGVRNFDNMEAGLKEMSRVLRPGGMVYVLEFSPPHEGIFGRLFRFYFHRVMPAVGGWVSGDREAYTYLPRSVEEFPVPETFRQVLSRCGLEPVETVGMFNGVAVIQSAKKI